MKKKAVRHQLYSKERNPRSSCRPSIFALPIFPPGGDVSTLLEEWGQSEASFTVEEREEVEKSQDGDQA